MANSKISGLTGATTPLAGTETLPVVQSGATKQVSIANLTLGRAVNTAGGTFTDNQTQGTAAKGINFTANTPAAGMTSQLLNWYEEGVISVGATCDSGTITLSDNSLYYTRIGRTININGKLTVASVSSPTGNVYFGLPIQANTSSTVCLYISGVNSITGEIPVGLINNGQSIFYIQKLNQLSGSISGAASIFKAGTQLNFQATYTT